MQTPDISVIITTYCVERYIARAVESVLAQEGVTLQIIIVDDASTDSTWDMIRTFTDPRIIAVRLDVNGGPSVARNRALALATGTWVAVLDGDDVFLPGRLARMHGIARDQKADVVVDNLVMQVEADGSQAPMFSEASLATHPRLTVESFIAHNANFSGGHGYGYFKPFLRTAFLHAHGITYRESIRIGEDYLFLLEALACGAHAVIDPQAGYGYTVRAGSISHRLTQADVATIQAEDARFFAAYTVSEAAMKHQRRRERQLKEAFAFTRMVAAVKSLQVVEFFAAAAACPSALRYWYKPVQARVQRLKQRIAR